MGHVIRPLVISRISLDKSLMTYLANIGTPISMPVVAWYVHADGKDVLIDTGATKECIDTYWPAGSQHVKTFEEALGQVGKKPEDIDMIISTHLHFDHIGHARACKNARVVVQEEELKFAYAPHPLYAPNYVRELLVDVKFEMIKGEKEILPGIRVIPTPGHSPGTQSVGIATDQGLAIITGFCATNATFEVPEEMKSLWPVFAPGIHCDALQAFDSALKVKEMADILIPLHEESFANAERIPIYA